MIAARHRRPRVAPQLVSGPALGIADAGVSSLGNFAVGVMAARTLDLPAFGTWSLALLLALVSTGLWRAGFSETLVLGHAADDPGPRRDAARRAVGAALDRAVRWGAAVAAIGAVVVWAGARDVRSALLVGVVLILVLPCLATQDVLRSVAYAVGRPAAALANSAAWTLALLTGLVVLSLSSVPAGPAGLLLLWGGTAGVGALAGSIATGTPVRPGGGARWLREHAGSARSLATDFALTQTSAETSMILVGVVAGAEATGLIRLGQLPLTPVIVLTNGLVAAVQPALVRRVAEGRGRSEIARLAWFLGLGSGAVALVLGVAVMVLPVSWVSLIVGDGWPRARALVPLLSLYLGLGALAACLGICLRSFGQVSDQVRARILLVPVTLVLVVLGAYLGGAGGAATALSASLVCTTLVWAWLIAAPRGTAP